MKVYVTSLLFFKTNTNVLFCRDKNKHDLQYNRLISLLRPLSQNVLDLIDGYFRHMKIITNEHIPSVTIPMIIPVSSTVGTETRKALHMIIIAIKK